MALCKIRLYSKKKDNKIIKYLIFWFGLVWFNDMSNLLGLFNDKTYSLGHLPNE